jgi:hypothetical protein
MHIFTGLAEAKLEKMLVNVKDPTLVCQLLDEVAE